MPEESITDLLELYPILSTLEVLAGHDSFPRLDEKDLMELHEINRDYAAAAERRDFRAGIELNDQFHHTLSRRSMNTHLESMLDDIRGTVSDRGWRLRSSGRDLAAQSAHDLPEVPPVHAGRA